MGQPSSRKTPAGLAAALAIMILATLLFSAPALRPGRTFAGVDFVTAFSPFNQTELASDIANPLQSDHATQLVFPVEYWESIRHGEVQQWEPDIGGGTPLGSAVYNRVWSPFYAVTFSWLPPWMAITASVMLLVLVAQLGSFWFARRLGLGHAAATLVAVAYGFSGSSISLLLRIHEVAWFPVVLALLHGSMTSTERVPWWRAGFASSVALLWFCGFPGGAVFALVGLGLTALAVSGALGGTAAEHLRRLAMAGGLVAAGTMVAALQLAPTWRFLAATYGLTRSYDAGAWIGLVRMAEAITPRFFGAFQDGDWWWSRDLVSGRFLGGLTSGNPVQAGTAFGMVVLSAMVGLVVTRRRRPAGSALYSVAALCTVVGLSAAYLGGPALWLLQRVPVASDSNPARARFLLAMGVALLAGAGLQAMMDRAEPMAAAAGWAWQRIATWSSALVLVAVAVAGALGVWVAASEGHLRELARDAVIPVAAVAALGVLWLVSRRSHGLVRTTAPFMVSIIAAVELIAGHWGHQPAVASAAARPTSAAIQSLAAGGNGRFISTAIDPVFPHATVPMDVPDARLIWPGTTGYQDLLDQVDPSVTRRSEREAVTVGIPDEEFAPLHPLLDRLAVSDILANVAALPLDLVSTGAVPVDAVATAQGAELVLPDLASDEDLVWRAVEFTILPQECSGIMDVTASRQDELLGRWRQGIAAGLRMRLALPDLAPGPLLLRASGCALAVSEVQVVPGRTAEVRLVDADGWQRYQNVGARPMVEAVTSVAAEGDRVRRLSRMATEPDVVFVEGSVPSVLAGEASQTTTRQGTDGATYEVQASGGSALLVVRENLAPGWSASIDGEPAALVTVDHAFRGVWVPAGSHEVAMTYVPDGTALGRWLAAVGVAVMLALALLPRRDPVGADGSN